uniref:Dwarfin sma n=1 Tax=Caenorhabditis tropicalis TaxID=1561998 RepID=A0A1I7SZS4_9PELO
MDNHHNASGYPNGNSNQTPQYSFATNGQSSSNTGPMHGMKKYSAGLEDIPDIEAYERSLRIEMPTFSLAMTQVPANIPTHIPPQITPHVQSQILQLQPLLELGTHQSHMQPHLQNHLVQAFDPPHSQALPQPLTHLSNQSSPPVTDDQSPLMSPVSTSGGKMHRNGIKVEMPPYLDPDSHDDDPEDGVLYPDPDLFDVKNTVMTEYELDILKQKKLGIEDPRKKMEVPDASSPPNKIVEFLMYNRTLKEQELSQINAYRTKRNRLSLNHIKNNAEREFDQKACESLVKKLKDKKHDLQNLINVVEKKGSDFNGCITIPRTLDGRLQVHGKKGFPHVVYGKLWRFSEMTKNETRHVDHCKHAFEMKSDLVCVNPYHYEIVIGTMIVGHRESHDSREMATPHSTNGHRYHHQSSIDDISQGHRFVQSIQMRPPPHMQPQMPVQIPLQHPQQMPSQHPPQISQQLQQQMSQHHQQKMSQQNMPQMAEQHSQEMPQYIPPASMSAQVPPHSASMPPNNASMPPHNVSMPLHNNGSSFDSRYPMQYPSHASHFDSPSAPVNSQASMQYQNQQPQNHYQQQHHLQYPHQHFPQSTSNYHVQQHHFNMPSQYPYGPPSMEQYNSIRPGTSASFDQHYSPRPPQRNYDYFGYAKMPTKHIFDLDGLYGSLEMDDFPNSSLIPGPNNVGMGPSNMGSRLSNMEPGSSSMGPGSSSIGPGSSSMGPVSSSMGPGSSSMGPGSSSTGPGPSNLGPRLSNMGSGPGNIGFGPDFNEPGPSSMGPGSSSMRPGSSSIRPRPNNMGSGPGNMGFGPDYYEPGPSSMIPGPSSNEPGPSNMRPKPSYNDSGTSNTFYWPRSMSPISRYNEPGPSNCPGPSNSFEQQPQECNFTGEMWTQPEVTVDIATFRRSCKEYFCHKRFNHNFGTDKEEYHEPESSGKMREFVVSDMLGVTKIKKAIRKGDVYNGDFPADVPYKDVCKFVLSITNGKLMMTGEEPESVTGDSLWGVVTYYEHTDTLGCKSIRRGDFHIDGGYIASSNRFSLGLEDNHQRSHDAFKVRKAIIDGIRFSLKKDRSVWIQNNMNYPIFVTSGYLDEEYGGRKEDKVHKIYGAGKLKVYGHEKVTQAIRDKLFSRQMARNHIDGIPTPMGVVYSTRPTRDVQKEAMRTVDSLCKYCCVKVSLCKGFGAGYPNRPSIIDCPVWLELKVNQAFDYMDDLQRNLSAEYGDPNIEALQRWGMTNVADD